MLLLLFRTSLHVCVCVIYIELLCIKRAAAAASPFAVVFPLMHKTSVSLKKQSV